MSVRYSAYASPIGVVYVASTDKGICSLTLSGIEADFRSMLRKATGFDAVRDEEFFSELKAQLDSYFQGKKVNFASPVDWLGGTIFQRSVWEILRRIPYGETRSYKDVAEAVERPRAYRSVGQAVGSNPVRLIVPCHRVINSDGGLGGFGSGLLVKKWLLELEGAKFVSSPH